MTMPTRRGLRRWGLTALSAGLALSLLAACDVTEPAVESTGTMPTAAPTSEPPAPIPAQTRAADAPPVDPSSLSDAEVAAVVAVGDHPGQPLPGTLLWGAAVQGDDPAVHHEDPAGPVLGLHRTFHQWLDRDTSMVQTAADDLAAGRLPWVSIKTPSWQAMASGGHDDEIDAMLTALDALRGPVWLAVHHEPEGGGAGGNVPDDPGGPAAHVAMNRQVRARMDALGVDNVALAPILMAYTWVDSSGRNPDEWWGDGVYDFLGVDIYTDEATFDIRLDTMREILDWASARGVDVGIGEWGVDNRTSEGPPLIERWFEVALASQQQPGARIMGMAYWDSDRIPDTGWRLQGDGATRFRDLVDHPATARWTDLVGPA